MGYNIAIYRLTEPIGVLKPGQMLVVTGRYGDWHLYDVKLEPIQLSDGRCIELTESELAEVTEVVDIDY